MAKSYPPINESAPRDNSQMSHPPAHRLASAAHQKPGKSHARTHFYPRQNPNPLVLGPFLSIQNPPLKSSHARHYRSLHTHVLNPRVNSTAAHLSTQGHFHSSESTMHPTAYHHYSTTPNYAHPLHCADQSLSLPPPSGLAHTNHSSGETT